MAYEKGIYYWTTDEAWACLGPELVLVDFNGGAALFGANHAAARHQL